MLHVNYIAESKCLATLHLEPIGSQNDPMKVRENMFDIALIGFVLPILGTFLLIVCAWIQVHSHNGILKDSAEFIFDIAGLLGGGGWLVFWASLFRYGVERFGMDVKQPLVYIFVLGVTGIMTVVTYKPFCDLVRNWVNQNTLRAEIPSRNKLMDIVERIRRL